ncbi:hypothetical protein CR205_10495 [Alteribacter lacisalsi]|uniref:Uncharacterized protein n=1 Tax=Alteribacter lacisalsi TaxID=2045244 RepID=A0A2W0HDN9_9BACI|nr:hypothetical protein CR205_10495 [Alteribacter lacisalsi]
MESARIGGSRCGCGCVDICRFVDILPSKVDIFLTTVDSRTFKVDIRQKKVDIVLKINNIACTRSNFYENILLQLYGIA